MTTKVKIYNQALSRVGSGKLLGDTNPNSTEAKVCNLHYDDALAVVLADHDWNFARRFVALQLVEENPNTDWLYAYRYPTGCVVARRILGPGRTDTTRIPFELGNDDSGLLIYTDQADAVLKYTHLFTNPAFFPPKFATALAWRLAAEVVMPLSQDQKKQIHLMQAYALELDTAEVTSSNEQQLDEPNAPEALSVR